MTTAARNEAAERLDHLIGRWSSPATKASLRAALDEALAAERRETVRRIQVDIAAAVSAILDEVAK